jgi:multidrug efflux pump subunit AcrA (membrane-fusion protein)
MLAKVNVRDGQTVKAGDILFEFDPRAAQTELQISQSRLAIARAKMPPAVAGQSEVDAAKAEIAAAEALIELDRLNLQALQIRAPIGGVLTTVDAVPGQYLHLNGPPLTQVIGTGDLKITFKLAFNDRTLLKVGRKITFTVGDKLQPFPAEITFISPTADSSNRTEIRARLTGEVEPLVPGVLGTVTIPDL